MKLLLRMLFYTVLVYASYTLLAGLMAQKPQLPKVLQHYADSAMQQYLCKTPVTWRIAQLDPAFDLTLEQAEQAAHSAAMQWNQAFGIELFRYDSLDGFAINFAYDERQQQILQNALLQRNLDRYDNNINQRVANLQQQSAQLQQQQRQFEAKNQQFAADVAAFEHKVQQPSADRSALRQEQQQLNRRQQQLQQQADSLNTEQQRLLREQQYINDTVADRNALLPQQTTEVAKTEVGLMEIRGKQRVMTIFAYKTLSDLQLTIVHEFGHALGVGHTDNPASIMHAALNATQNRLTADDIQALKSQCNL